MVNSKTKDPAHQLYKTLREITVCCQEREELQARSFGLTSAEARCLNVMLLSDIRNTAELAEKMLIAKSRVTRILDGLVKKDLVIRSESKADRRLCLVTLTAAGSRIATGLMESILKVHEEVLKGLPEAERDNVLNTISSLYDEMLIVKRKLQKESGSIKNDGE
ncbi:MarR family winged helix-turn-helix transcriptional regulator [bacterium]|nr:MarR family winged helix-turn-helix transcriptional regulator [bacterium]MBU1653186.1 MarR family winged helix-turn-helix transcriptional regulator [bacterium]